MPAKGESGMAPSLAEDDYAIHAFLIEAVSSHQGCWSVPSKAPDVLYFSNSPAPATGASAAGTTPPPSLSKTTPGARVSSRLCRSPVPIARRNAPWRAREEAEIA